MGKYIDSLTGKIMVSIEDIPKLNALLAKASEEAAQLNKTLAQLREFNLEVSLLTDQAGEIEAASSTSNDIPMK